MTLQGEAEEINKVILKGKFVIKALKEMEMGGWVR